MKSHPSHVTPDLPTLIIALANTPPLRRHMRLQQDEDVCGSVVESLCPLGELGCASDPDLGGYEAFMPEPLGGISSSGYRVQIAQVGYSDERTRCSDVFFLQASGDMATGTLSVTEPSEDAVGFAGDEYTVEVRQVGAVSFSVCMMSGYMSADRAFDWDRVK